MQAMVESQVRGAVYAESLRVAGTGATVAVWDGSSQWLPQPNAEEALIACVDSSYGRSGTRYGLAMLAEVRLAPGRMPFRGQIIALSFDDPDRLWRDTWAVLLKTCGATLLRLPVRLEEVIEKAVAKPPLTTSEWQATVTLLKQTNIPTRYEFLRHRLSGALAVPLAAARAVERLGGSGETDFLFERAVAGLRQDWAAISSRLASLEPLLRELINLGMAQGTSPESLGEPAGLIATAIACLDELRHGRLIGPQEQTRIIAVASEAIKTLERIKHLPDSLAYRTLDREDQFSH